ncbi:MAG: corrinoid protein [Deltaproteobacteria bacterium]|nr:corrinoid protein [Deltaproteobacteria bacterium]
MSQEVFENLNKAVIEGDEDKILELTHSAIEQGLSPDDILKKGLIPGIRKVGELFNSGEYFLPELIVSGKAMEKAVQQLTPLFHGETASNTGKFLIGTVRGDVHDIGKNIVIMMLKSNGWEVTDLGVDIPPDQFCTAIREGNYNICGMSALLTMTMPAAEETIKALESEGLRDKIKVMIGGAPVTQEYADQIGADAFGKDAWDAVTKAENLLKMN